ncbi:MAG: hypothetical protein KAU83_03975, partial [Bacteroidales bacterium]|nr:hypothetical protein [Bacteroidales bacterium]
CGLRIGYMVTDNSRFAEAVRKGVHIWNVNGFAEEFLRMLPDYKNEFLESCARVRSDRDKMYHKINSINGMTVYKPDANYIYCRLPDNALDAPRIARDLFIKHNMFVKECTGKNQPEADRYLRIASRTEEENSKLIEALIEIMNNKDGGLL